MPAQNVLGAVFRDLVEVDEQGVATPASREAGRCGVVPRGAGAGRRVHRCTASGHRPCAGRHRHGRGRARSAAARVAAACATGSASVRIDLRAVRQAEAAAAEWQRASRDETHFWPHERQVVGIEALSQTRHDAREPRRAGEVLPPPRGRSTAGGTGAPRNDALSPRRDRRPARPHRRSAARCGLRPDGLPDIVWCEVPGGHGRTGA